jgi:glycosyltransferase involved in cell wall biosynthesis
LRRVQPDLVLTRYAGETLSIHWACRSLGIPVVTEFNGLDRRELAGTYRQFQVLNRLFSNGSALRWSVGATCVSEPIAAALRRSNPLEKPILVNPNGVDVAVFHPSHACGPLRDALHIPRSAIVIGFVGSFMEWHDPARLLRAFSTLLGSGIDAYLVFVGRKVPDLVRCVEAAGASWARRIRLTGFVPYAEVPSYIGLFDIAVMPNTNEYVSPLKLFEYMAMAKPCVAPASAPIRAIMADGVEGLLFEPGDEAAFVAALRRVAHDPTLRRSLGEAARARVERDFTWEKNAARVMRLVEEAYAWYRRWISAPSARRSGKRSEMQGEETTEDRRR